MADPVMEFERLYSAGQYFAALVALLPQGPYWDAQLANSNSDLVRELELQAANFQLENAEIANALKEGFPWRAERTLRAWEQRANLDGFGKTIAQRQEALRNWRAGSLANWERFATMVATYQMRLLRIDSPQKPFTTHTNINSPLYSRRDGNVRYFIVDPQGMKVRPDWAKSPATINDHINKPLLGQNYNRYAPFGPAGLLEDIQEALPLPYKANIIYSI